MAPLTERIAALTRVVTDMLAEVGETEPSDAHTEAELDLAFDAATALLEGVEGLVHSLRPLEAAA